LVLFIFLEKGVEILAKWVFLCVGGCLNFVTLPKVWNWESLAKAQHCRNSFDLNAELLQPSA